MRSQWSLLCRLPSGEPGTGAQVLLPSWPPEQRFEVTALGIPGCYRVVCRLGYADAPDKNAAFLDALLQALLQEARFQALSAKCAPARSPACDSAQIALRVQSDTIKPSSEQ